MTWTFGSFELPPTSIRALLELGKLGPSDVFVDLGSGTGKVVMRAAQVYKVRLAIGVELEVRSRERARLDAIKLLNKEQLSRVDFWLGDIHSEDFEYDRVTVVYNSFEEDEEEVPLYREKFPRRFRLLKKDLPLVGYAPSGAVRRGRTWFFRMDFPLTRVRSKAKWANLVMGRPNSTVEDVYDHYRNVWKKRGTTAKDARIGLNKLEGLLLKRF